MNAPLGFDEAKAGDLFLKVGVGHLRRKDDSPYHFSKKYEIVNRGKWEVSSGEAFFEAVHVIEPLRDWGYEYKKRIELVDPASIAITYRLKNTGQRTISTDYYSHNFFVFNSEMIGEGDGVEILADNAAPKLRPPAQVHPRKVEFTGDIIPGKGYFLEVPLPDSLENRPLARIYQKRSGASVVISSTCSPYKLAIYGHSRALCAEPFVRIQLEPGKEMEWTDTYQLIVRR
ncbi:hypothetical protein DB346_21390 [Verrucomicrobia bacterium LW23]|nr:hypothetical protein DB346_21390 [Verrucomicrobia bacterium LW23]